MEQNSSGTSSQGLFMSFLRRKGRAIQTNNRLTLTGSSHVIGSRITWQILHRSRVSRKMMMLQRGKQSTGVLRRVAHGGEGVT